MKRNLLWLEITGWVNMLRPYILPFWGALTFLYAVIVVKIILGLFKIPKGTYSLFKVSLHVAIIAFVTFVLEATFTHVFVTLMHFNDPRYGFVEIIDSYGLSIYDNIWFFIFTLISVCFCVYISYKLNSRYTLPYLELLHIKKAQIIILISILTSPLIFFIPFKELLYTFPFRW